MIDSFRQPSRCTPIVARNFLDFVPVRQKPSFEVILSSMGKKGIILPHPIAHLLLRIRSVDEIPIAGVHICQRDDGVCRLATREQLLYCGSKTFPFRNSPVVRKHIQVGHPAGKPSLEERCQVRFERLLGSTLH